MTTMELKSISCKGVKSGIPFQKPSLYAVVSVARAGNRKHNHNQQKKTAVDRTGGENPEWDRPLQLDIDGRREHDLLLEFKIKTHGIFGDRVVGEVRVPVSDLESTTSTPRLRQVSYQVRSPDGKPNGVLSFFYKMGDLVSTVTAPSPAPDWGFLYPPPPSTTTPPTPAPADVYPPPPSPALNWGTLYPPPSSTTTPPADVYPPPPSSTVSNLGCYPTPDPVVAYPPSESGFGFFSTPDPVPWPAAEYCYPPPGMDMGCVYPAVAGGGGYYPPPPPVNVVYPPPTGPACCYPASSVPYSYRAEGWNRGLCGCN